MDDLTTILAYLGPETMLPMTSAVAGVAGVVLLVGRGALRWASNAVQSLLPRAESRSKPRVGGRRIGHAPVGPMVATDRGRTRS